MATATKAILLGAACALAVYDVVVYLAIGPSATISTVLLAMSASFHTIPYLVGVIVGHVFIPSHDLRSFAVRLTTLVGLSGMVIAADLTAPSLPVWLALGVGIACGRWFWPQPKPRRYTR